MIVPPEPRRGRDVTLIVIAVITVIALVIAALAFAGLLSGPSGGSASSSSQVTRLPGDHRDKPTTASSAEALPDPEPPMPSAPPMGNEEYCAKVAGAMKDLVATSWNTVSTEELRAKVADIRALAEAAPEDLVPRFTAIDDSIDQVRLAQQTGQWDTPELTAALGELEGSATTILAGSQGSCQ